MISLKLKSFYLKKVYLVFPKDDILFNKMKVVNFHIMLGDSFLLIPKLNKLDSDYF